MNRPDRHQLFDCFVLHRRDYGNSGLLVDVFSRTEGRFPVLAKGAKRPRNPGSALLQAFQPLLMAVSGRGEVKTLLRVESAGFTASMLGESLYCGFYVNELMMRLLPRNDAHETLFDDYAAALTELAATHEPSPVLRRFELQLLAQTGYAMVLDREADTGLPVEPDLRYLYQPERGMVRIPPDAAGFSVSGRTLMALADKRSLDVESRREAKLLMRRVLSAHLGERPLKSRELFQQLFLKDG